MVFPFQNLIAEQKEIKTIFEFFNFWNLMLDNTGSTTNFIEISFQTHSEKYITLTKVELKTFPVQATVESLKAWNGFVMVGILDEIIHEELSIFR